MAYRGSVNTVAGFNIIHFDLRSVVKGVAYEFPINQISTVIDGNSRKILKCRGNQIKIVTDPANRGIGIESSKYRVVDYLCWHMRIPFTSITGFPGKNLIGEATNRLD